MHALKETADIMAWAVVWLVIFECVKMGVIAILNRTKDKDS